MIYAVIDTNVLVSALYTHNPQSPTARVVDAVSIGQITPLYNEEILSEYTEVLQRPKFHFSLQRIQDLLRLLKIRGLSTSRIPYEGAMPDEKDRPFFEVSLSEDGSFLVTGNLKHFPITPQVVSPAQMMEIVEKGLSSAQG